MKYLALFLLYCCFAIGCRTVDSKIKVVTEIPPSGEVTTNVEYSVEF